MGRFDDAVALANVVGGPADISAVRRYTSRGGISINIEQLLASNVGFFARAGVASGDIEPYEFSDIDRTVAAGLSVSGKQWGRPDDTFGIGGVVNRITGSHKLPQRGRTWHPGRRWKASERRSRKNHGGLLQLAGGNVEADAGLSIHCKPRLQSRPGTGLRGRCAPSHAVVIHAGNHAGKTVSSAR